jgi:hypothetical protein
MRTSVIPEYKAKGQGTAYTQYGSQNQNAIPTPEQGVVITQNTGSPIE